MLAVKFYAQTTQLEYVGYPPYWPWQTRTIQERQEAALDETVMTQEEFNAYIAQHQASYDAWMATREDVKNRVVDLASFRFGIFQHPAYQELTLAAAYNPASNLCRDRLETEIRTDNPHLPTVQLLWNRMLQMVAAEHHPNAQAIVDFNGVATRSNIALAFDPETGVMILH